MMPDQENTNCCQEQLNVAIVGGGETCKFFLQLLQQQLFSSLQINILGVCDVDPEAEGLKMAREMSLSITHDFRDFFAYPNLHTIIELTNDKEVLLELIRARPQHIGVLEHNLGRLLQRLYEMDRRLHLKEQEAFRERMISEFLIQQTNERILILNPDYTIAQANKPFLNWVNKKRHEVIGSYCFEVTYGFERPCSVAQPEWKCPLLETLQTGNSSHVIHDQPAFDSPANFCDIITYPVRDESGRIVKVIEILHDITQELLSKWDRRTQDLKEDLEKLVREDRMITLGKLVASCVHEINNPLQGLITYAYIIEEILSEDRPQNDELQKACKYISVMKRELERCGNITSGLLSFSRETCVEFRDIDLNEVILSTVSLTQHRMELQNIQLIKELSPSPLIIKGDVNQLQQCMLNLLFNAIEAMPQGGQIKISNTLEKSGTVRIAVEDTGCGIAEEDLGHIFDPFFTTKQGGEGTGLGLSILYGIVTKHEGTVDVESTSEKGTAFILRFPIAQQEHGNT